MRFPSKSLSLVITTNFILEVVFWTWCALKLWPHPRPQNVAVLCACAVAVRDLASDGRLPVGRLILWAPSCEGVVSICCLCTPMCVDQVSTFSTGYRCAP